MKNINYSWSWKRSRFIACGIFGGLCLTLLMTDITFASAGDDKQEKPPWVAPRRSARKKNPVPSDAQSLQIGRGVYERECISCHGADGRGKGPKAAELDTPPGNLTDPVMWEQSDGALFWKISKGRAPMAGFKTLLTDEQRWHVLNYIRTMAPQRDMVVEPTYDVPYEYRKAISTLIEPYMKVHAALLKKDLDSVKINTRLFAKSLNDLKLIKTEQIDATIREYWSNDVFSLSEKLKGLDTCQDIVSKRQCFAGLSASLAEMIGHFGHNEKTPLYLFAAKATFAGRPGTWLQTQNKPANLYDGPEQRLQGQLKKKLGASQKSKS